MDRFLERGGPREDIRAWLGKVSVKEDVGNGEVRKGRNGAEAEKSALGLRVAQA